MDMIQPRRNLHTANFDYSQAKSSSKSLPRRDESPHFTRVSSVKEKLLHDYLDYRSKCKSIIEYRFTFTHLEDTSIQVEAKNIL